MDCQREYTGAIAPAFGENVITHNCGCGLAAQGASAHGSIPVVVIGIAVGIAVALLTKSGGAQ